MAKFWLVWHDNGGYPTAKHAHVNSARREAERLARANPGKSFHVLALLGTAVKDDVKWTDAPAGGGYEPAPF